MLWSEGGFSALFRRSRPPPELSAPRNNLNPAPRFSLRSERLANAGKDTLINKRGFLESRGIHRGCLD